MDPDPMSDVALGTEKQPSMVAGETGSTVAGGGMDADGGSAVVRIIQQEQNTGAEDGLEKIPLER